MGKKVREIVSKIIVPDNVQTALRKVAKGQCNNLKRFVQSTKGFSFDSSRSMNKAFARTSVDTDSR